MAGVNKVILIGNLGRDPELKKTPNGASVATLNLATTEKRKDANGQVQSQTEWHSVVLWNKQAELAHQYLKKGSPVYIEGKIKTRNWEKDGQKHYKTEIWANAMQFLSAGGQNSAQANNTAQTAQNSPQNTSFNPSGQETFIEEEKGVKKMKPFSKE